MGSPQSEFPFSSCISRINRGSQANGRYRRVLSPNRLVHEPDNCRTLLQRERKGGFSTVFARTYPSTFPYR